MSGCGSGPSTSENAIEEILTALLDGEVTKDWAIRLLLNEFDV